MTKKLISIVLAVCMLFSIFAIAGVSVQAAEGDTTGTTVYLQPGVWSNEGSPWFAAYFFEDGKQETSVKMTAVEGKYMAAVPAGYTNVIFVRMNPDYQEFDWKGRWDQTENLTVQPLGTYTITGFGEMSNISPGEWSTPAQTDTTTAQEPSAAKVVHVDVTAPGLSGAWRIWTWNDNEDGVWTRLAYGAATVRDNFVMAHFANADDADDWKYVDWQTTDAAAVDGASYKILNEKVNEDNKEKYKLVNVSEETTTAAGTTEPQETTAPKVVRVDVTAPGLTGAWRIWTWNTGAEGTWTQLNDGSATVRDNFLMAHFANADDADDWKYVDWQTTDAAAVDGASYKILNEKVNEDNKEKYKLVNVSEETTTAAGTTEPQETTGGDTSTDYYLAGDMNQWSVNAAYKFTANSAAPGEYVLNNVSLTTGQKFKVVKAEGTEIVAYYPDGVNNDYVVTTDIAGTADIYFRPATNDEWKSGFDKAGYIWVAKQPSEEIEVPDAPEGYVNVFLTDTVGWGNVYAYSWDKNGTPTTSWDNAPKMTFVKNDTNGKPVYYVAVPNNCDGIVFNNRTDKTVDATPVSAGAHWKIGSFKQNGDHGEKVYNLEFVEDAGGYAYYLTGSMNTPANVTTWTDAYKFTEGADGNFTLETTLAENNWLKVVRVNLDANNKPTKIAVWYPASNGSDNQDYVVPAALAGNVKITFNPAGNKWNSFHAGGFFTIEKTAAPSPVKIDNFKAYIVNMVFGESLSMKFYVKSAVLDGYTDAYMVFTREGKQTIAQMEGPDSDGDYYFTFKSLYPQLVVDDINAELHAFKNGVEYYGDIYTDSGERYIKRCLEKYKSGSTLKYRNARTMYVDMAIYCGLMQKKMHHKDTTHLITDYLTEEQLSWASTSVETKNDRVFDYKKCENADTQWTASNIVFSDVVVTKAYFKTNSIAGKTVKVTFDGRESTYTEADFIHDSSCDANEYYIEFGDLFARQMSTLCYFTVYNASGTACSPTMQYSIDSYANIIHNHPKYQGQEIDLICQAMVKYGHSVYNYLYNVE